ncbi:MAG: ATP-binding protein [Burkholderiaceae bacterium]|jgi:signal transduction histidine kinase|nr:ATP-binding protein [Burkholderiaceae bacterium]
MSSPAHASAARNGAWVFAALAVLAGFLAFQPIRFAIDHLGTHAAVANSAVEADSPLFAVFASSALAFVAVCFALVAWLRWTRAEAALDGLAATATRIAIGERGLRALPRASVLDPLAGALNRLGALNESAEAMLVDRNRQLATVRRQARVGYWETDRDGRVQRVEYEPSWPTAERWAPIGGSHLDQTRPIDRQAWQAALEALAARRPYSDLVVERTSVDGRRIQVIESGEPRFGADSSFLGYCGTVRRIDAASTTRHAAMQAAVDTGSRCVFVLSRSPWPPPIAWMNAAGQAMAGQGAHGGSSTIGPILETADAEALHELQQALLHGHPLRRSLTVRDRYGVRTDAIAHLEPLQDGSGAFVLVLDAQAAQIERLREAADGSAVLRAKVRDLERQAHQLDVLAWSVAHDLRAPLRAVDGFARIVLEDHAPQLDADAQSHLQRVVAAGARMERMIDALMALARSTTHPMQRVPVDLSRLAQDIMRDLMRTQPQRTAQVHCEPSLVVEGDPGLLRLMLQNLLENAWKYTSKNPIASIRFDAHDDKRGRTVYCVADNGRGFDSVNADRLFAPFQRLHADDDVPGTGIGLAIVQQIVQRHGGAIWAESRPGEGSRFHFTLAR